MLRMFRSMSQGAGVAVAYITLGILTMIWTAIWYNWLRNHGTPEGDWKNYVCAGLFFSGLAVTLIGLLLGQIGRAAKKADKADIAPGINTPSPAAGVAAAPVAPPPVIVTQPMAPMMAPGQPMAAPQPMMPQQPMGRIQPT